MIVNVADLVTPPNVAEIPEVVVADTVDVVTVNVPLVFPPAIVTDPETVAAEFPLLRITTMPPVGAALPRVTVPVDVLPPFTEAGLRVRDLRTGGPIVSVPNTVEPFNVAEMVALT